MMTYNAKKLRELMGNPEASIPEIRKYLAENGHDPHAGLRISSFDALLVSLDGIIYGYRRVPEQKSGNKELSLFGGTVKEETVTKEAVASVILNKTPITGIVPEQIELFKDSRWNGDFIYANGDKVRFNRTGALIFLNDEQEEQLKNGDKSKFHSQIKEVAILNGRQDDLYDYQQEIYSDILNNTGILE